jgi:hypothetical protein
MFIMLDVFNNSAFNSTTLTDTINKMLYRPSRLKELGLFNPTPVAQPTIAIETTGDILRIIEPGPRGTPGKASENSKRSLRPFTIPHFPAVWSVMADEVSGLRAVGSESELMPFQTLVGQKLVNELVNFDLTEEATRLGAITGKIVYAGANTPALDLFTEFGVTQAPEIALSLATASDGALRKSCTDIIRKTKAALGGIPFDYVHCMCGDEFFDALLSNKEVRSTYLNWSEAQILQESYVGANRGTNPIFKFGGIIFENYGEINDEGVGIPKTKANFFPMGVHNLFRTYYAPAPYVETVNTLGKRIYVMQMNALQLCTRPAALLRGKL